MANIIFLIPIEDERQTRETVEVLPFPVLEDLAEKKYESIDEFVKELSENALDLTGYHVIHRYIQDDHIHVTVTEEFPSEIVINKSLELHVSTSEGNIAIDYYRYADEELMENEDYDFDDDFIRSTWFDYNDLTRDEEAEDE